MKVKFQVYNPNFVGKRERKKKKTFGHIILLGSIK